MKRMLMTVMCLCMIGAVVSAGVITSSDTAPTDVIASGAVDAPSYTRLWNPDVVSNYGRGNEITSDDGGSYAGYVMDALVLRKKTSQDFTGSTTAYLTLHVFEGTKEAYDAGDGGSDGDIWDGTGITTVYTETFALTDSYSDLDYVTFNLDTPITMADQMNWLCVYEQGDSSHEYFEISQYSKNAGGNSAADGWQYFLLTDDNSITGSPLEYYAVEAVSKSAAPDPADAETHVGVDLADRIVPGALSWEGPAPEEIVELFGYNLYMDPNETKVLNATPASTDLEFMSLQSDGQIEASFDPGVDLDFDTTYFWRVDSIVELEPGNDPNTLAGDVWTFTTVPESPVITGQPGDQAAFPGDDVDFIVEAYDPQGSPMEYTWYYSDDTDFDPATDDVVSGPVTGDDTLTVPLAADTATAVFGQQGYYYCVVDNGTETPAQSEAAYLKVRHLLSHYALDGNANDSSIYGNDGIWPKPSLETYNTTDPAVGSGSVVFAGTDPNSYIDLGTGAAPNPEMARDYTEGSFSFWLKTTNSTDTMAVVGAQNDGVTSQFTVTVNNGEPGRIALYMRNEAGYLDGVINSATAGDSALVDGQWHHVAIVWEGTAADAYIDGELVSFSHTLRPTPMPGVWQYPMALGAKSHEIDGIDSYFVGELDEVKMSNYPLTELEVIDEYLAGPADWICTNPPAMDFNDDCIVDIADFAIFAAGWLECGRDPDTQCQY